MNENMYNAEAAIIGGLMLFPVECSQAFERLTANDFENPYASKAFEAILNAHKNGEKYDAAIFGSSNAEPEVKEFVMTACQTFLSTENFDGYVGTVKDNSLKKKTKEKLQEIIFEENDYQKIISDIESIVDKAKEEAEPSNFGDYLADYLLKLDEPVNLSDRIKSGFSKLDKNTRGFRKGSLCYIGAYPGTGKTSFAINVSDCNIKEHKMVQFFSLEMSKQQILDRFFSSSLGIDYTNIDMHKLHNEEKDEIIDYAGRILAKNNVEIVDNVYTIEAIGGRISKFKPDLVIVDFLQNIRTAKPFKAKKEQVDYISAELKRFARVNECAIICLSQLKRSLDKPRMSDLKESGNLEADGDYIILMYRPYVTDKVNYRPEETQLLLDKNKYGECGVIDMYFDTKHQKFLDIESRYEEQ